MFNQSDVMPPYAEYMDDFELDEQTNELKLKKTAAKEAIQCQLRFPITKAKYGDIVYNPVKLSEIMIEEFKKLEIYQSKSEEERQVIIQYLKDNPDIEDPNPDVITII